MQVSIVTFVQIISGINQYQVPLFQRPYCWSKEEWSVLWEDLVALCENENDNSNHFIGSIVIIPLEVSSTRMLNQYLLVDGQQRITTLTILLALLRDELNRTKDNIGQAKEITGTMLINEHKQGSERLKLIPTKADQEDFKRLIEKPELIPESNTKKDDSDDKQDEIRENRILACYLYFRRLLRKSRISLSVLRDKIASNLTAVRIILEEKEDPYLIFETLNAKGSKLTASDLIRNYIFMPFKKENEQQAHYDQYWYPMQEALGEHDSLTKYIQHYLMKDGGSINERDIYTYFKQRLENLLESYITGKSSDPNKPDSPEPKYSTFSGKIISTLEDKAIVYLDVLKEMATFAGYYAKLLDPTREPNKEIASAISKLNCLEVTTAYPFLLNCYHAYCVEKSIAADDFVAILKMIENFVIRRFVCCIPTNALSKMFPGLYKQAKAKQYASFVLAVAESLQKHNYPTDREFFSELIQANFYSKNTKIRNTKVMFILQSLEMSFPNKERPSFDQATIEHIMPQTLTDWWKDNLGTRWHEDYTTYLDTLGNLTITGYNTELGNLPWTEKKAKLSESHFAINEYFRNIVVWDRIAIETRAEILAKKALEIWPYFGTVQNHTTIHTAMNVSESSSTYGSPPASPQSIVNQPPASPQSIVNQSPASPQSVVNQPPASPQSIVNQPPASPQSIVNQPPTSPQSIVNQPPTSPQSIVNQLLASPQPPTLPLVRFTVTSKEDVTGFKPRVLFILGHKYYVDSWRDVMTYSLNEIAEWNSSIFIQIVAKYPSYISQSAEQFRSYRKLNNGFFIETNLGSKSIYNICCQIIHEIGLGDEDWIVEVE